MEKPPIKKTSQELMDEIHLVIKKIFGPEKADAIELWRKRNGDKLNKLIEFSKKWLS
jgi:hypothetical protein